MKGSAMDSNAETKKIEQEMNETLKSIRALGACLEGSIKENARAKYVKKDGSVSHYPTAPILQYRIGPKKRGYRRIPAARVEEIRRLLENGKQYRELADRYEALSARLALRFKKKA
jgi:hypothetical protein